MNKSQIDQLMMMYGSKIPSSSYYMICDRLEQMDWPTANMICIRMKDPTISLILSIFVGCFGVDRFYMGDIGLGVFKLITCGGFGLWWLIDLFLVMDSTKEKNAMMLMNGAI